jgi:hypothetical protein
MAPGAAPSWSVTGQQETSDIGPQGTYVPGVRVTFQLENGTVGQVFLAQADYSVEKARAAIAAKAATMAAVSSLTAEG